MAANIEAGFRQLAVKQASTGTSRTQMMKELGFVGLVDHDSDAASSLFADPQEISSADSEQEAINAASGSGDDAPGVQAPPPVPVRVPVRPMPAAEAVADPGVARQSRMEPWGPFALAAVLNRGVQIGWGATCKIHTNAIDLPSDSACKKQLTYGGGRLELLSDAQCRLLLKRWLRAGMGLTKSRTMRTDHIQIQPRELTKYSESELDDWVATL